MSKVTVTYTRLNREQQQRIMVDDQCPVCNARMYETGKIELSTEIVHFLTCANAHEFKATYQLVGVHERKEA